MFGSRGPPRGLWRPCHHASGIALLLRALLNAPGHEFQSFTVWLQPEVDGVLLRGPVLGVEEHVGEKAVAMEAAHQAYVFERELQVFSCSAVPEDKHTTIRLHVRLN